MFHYTQFEEGKSNLQAMEVVCLMTLRLIRKEEYDSFCHEARNALVCMKYVEKRLEQLVDNLYKNESADADDFLSCLKVLKNETQRIVFAVEGSSKIWNDVATSLIEREKTRVADRKPMGG